MICFSLVAFKICSSSFGSLIRMFSVWLFLSSFHLGVFELLVYLCSYLSSNLVSFQPSFLRMFSAPFSPGTPAMCMLILLMVSHRSLRFCPLSSIFLLGLNDVHCFIFKFTDSSTCSNQPLSHSHEFFITVVVFSSGIVFLLGFVSLYFHFVYTFSWLSSHLPLVL